jgi:hypothetical protein
MFFVYLFSFFSYKIREQEGRTSPVSGEGWQKWKEGGVGKKEVGG